MHQSWKFTQLEGTMKQIKYSAIASALLLAGVTATQAATPINLEASADDGNVASNTIDSDLTTRWSANGNDGSQWIQYDFGSEVPLSGVSIAFYKGDSRNTYFRIESSNDGSTWTTEIDSTSSGDTLEQEEFAFAETVTARYIRYVGLGNSSNTWNSVTEIDFNDAEDTDTEDTDTDNIYLDIEPNAEASSDDGNVAENVLDYDLDTRWSANGSGEWIQLDLQQDKELHAVQLAFYKGDARQGIFKIETSTDGSNWTTVLDETYSSGNSADLETFGFEAIYAQYVRYTGFGNTANSWNSLTEFRAIDTNIETDTDTDSDTDTESDSDSDTDTATDTDSDSDTESETDTETDSDSDTDIVTGETHYATPDSLDEVVAAASAGDQIIVTGSGEISLKNYEFTSQLLIRAESVGGTTLTNATITNCNNITLQGFVFGPNDESTLLKIVNSTNIKVLQNTFDHDGVSESQSSIVMTQASDTIEIAYNEFLDKNVSDNGSKVTGSFIKTQFDDPMMTKNLHIHHNHFKNITPYLVDGTPTGDSDREAIAMGIADSQSVVTSNIIEYNLFENCDGENEIITVKTSGNTFRYNTFKNSMGSLSFRLGTDNKAYGNYFYGEGSGDSVTDDNYQTGGVRVYGEGHSVYDNYMEGLTGTSWRRPILIDSGDTSSSVGNDSHQVSSNVLVSNNTIVDSTGGGIHIGGDKYSKMPFDITITNNTVVGSEGTLFNNVAEDSSNIWSGNAAYATGSATANGGGTLSSSELSILSSSPSINKPTALTASDVGPGAK